MKNTYNKLVDELSFAFINTNLINPEIFKELYFESKKDSLIQKSFMIISGDEEIEFMQEGYHKKLPIDVITHFDLKSYEQKIKSCYVVKSKQFSNTLIFALNNDGDKLLGNNKFKFK